MVVKGEPQFYPHSPKMQAMLNPYSLFEILSESTEDRDKFDKWENSYVNQPEQTLRIAGFDVSVADIYMLVKFPEKKQPENPQP